MEHVLAVQYRVTLNTYQVIVMVCVVIGYPCFQLEYADNSSIRHNRTFIGTGLSVFQYGLKQRKLYIG